MSLISHINTSKGVLNIPLDYKGYLDKNLINHYQDVRFHIDNSIDPDSLYNVECKFNKPCVYNEPYYRNGSIHRRPVVLTVASKGNYYYFSDSYDMLKFFSPMVMVCILVVAVLVYFRR